MTRSTYAALALLAAFTLTGASCGGDRSAKPGAKAGADALPTGDQLAWNVFIQAVGGSASGSPPFEGWASDFDTFKPNATWPQGEEAKNGLDLRSAVLPTIGKTGATAAGGGAAAAHRPLPGAVGAAPTAAAAAPAKAAAAPAAGTWPPPNANNEPGSVATEEVRRNQAAFSYIVDNNLNTTQGLAAKFGQTITFPVDSVEVKTNWLPVSQIPQFYPNLQGSVQDNFYVTPDANGQPHALIAMHVISKAVPNWTWATFEHQLNPGRCDFMGCRDSFGSQTPYIPPADNQGQSQGQVYAGCPQTPALQAMLSAGGVAAVFNNYCLKGSQSDFTDPTGAAIRLANSVTEWSFAWSGSCMTCHATAGWNAQGGQLTGVNALVGPVPANLYWSGGSNPLYPDSPPYQGQPGATQVGTSADFVWAIPVCAFDANNPAQRPCQPPPPATPAAAPAKK